MCGLADPGNASLAPADPRCGSTFGLRCQFCNQTTTRGYEAGTSARARPGTGRILLGSDIPFGTTAAAAIVAIRCGFEVGLTPAQVAAVTGGQLERVLAGEAPLDLGPAPGTAVWRPPLLERVITLLVAALSRMLEEAAAAGLIELARLGCQVDPDADEASMLRSVDELLARQQRYATTTTLDGRRSAGFHLVLAAAAVAAAPRAPLPSLE